MASNLQKYLSALNGAVPDLGELKRLNVPLQKAIAICEAAAKAEPKPAPLVKAPEPLPFAEPEPRIISTHVLPAAPLREPLAKKQTGIAGMDKPSIRSLPLPAAPAPRIEPQPYLGNEPIGPALALSLLHDVAAMIDAERGCASTLHAAGWSWETAKEIAWTINQLRNN